MKKVFFVGILLSLVFVLSSCGNNDLEEFEYTKFVFDIDLVQNYFTTYDENEIVIEATVTTDLISDLEILSEGFYRTYENSQYVYYTMDSEEIYRQDNTTSTGYGNYLIDNGSEALIGIDDGTNIQFFLSDGTNIGNVLKGFYYFNVDQNDIYRDGKFYLSYLVEYDYGLLYNIILDMQTGEYYYNDYRENQDFNFNTFIDELSATSQSADITINKSHLPFFEEDNSDYYYIKLNNSFLIYDIENTLVNSFAINNNSGVTFLFGTKIINQDTTEVPQDDLDYTYSSFGRRFKVTTTSYDIITGEYLILNVNYLVVSHNYIYDNVNVSSNYQGVGIIEFGPNKTIKQEVRFVLLDKNGEIKSDLLGFTPDTLYNDGIIYDVQTNSLFTDELTLISNKVIYYSPEFDLYVTMENGKAGCYDMDSNALLDDEYTIKNISSKTISLEKDNALYVFDFASKQTNRQLEVETLLFSNDTITVLYNETNNSINVYDSSTNNELEIVDLEKTSTPSLYYSIKLLSNFYEVGFNKGYVLISTADGILKINYNKASN